MFIQREQEEIYAARCHKFYTDISRDVMLVTIPLDAVYANTKEIVPYEKRLELTYKPLHEGELWGSLWESAWIHLQAQIPSSWQDQELVLMLDLSGESLLFDSEGIPVASFTGNCQFDANYQKLFYRLPEGALSNGKLDYYCEAAANTLFGATKNTNPHRSNEVNPNGTFPAYAKKMCIGIFSNDIWQLKFDIQVLMDLYEAFPADDYHRKKILAAVSEAINLYADNPDNAVIARTATQKYLQLPAMASALNVSAVGHAHIDVGWLWPVRESVRKAARTFSTQIELLERYPDYVFGASQPALYEFVRDYYPELYKKVKKYVAEGRWELQGGMYVEADCNLTSGESLVRQFLHGKNFFRDEFNIEVHNCWIPDVFGYTANMPQIIRKSDCDTFLTQKLSWSQFNKFPYHTFQWQGIDDTKVLTHFPPENTYNSPMLPKEFIKAQNNYNESAIVPEFISLFGIGDGGGGPSEEFIERGLRMQNLESVPKVHFSRADDCFKRLHRYENVIPTWKGELYLEVHRGTLTTQARNKRHNRKLEQALTAVEFLYSCLPLSQYPIQALDKLWKKLLVNQFHDILPGSSIEKVYETAEKEYHDAFAECDQLVERGLKGLTKPDPQALTLVNTLSYPYNAQIELPESWKDGEILDAKNKPLPMQVRANGKIAVLAELPQSSITTWYRGKKHTTPEAIATANLSMPVLENALVRYEFNPRGELIRAFDKKAQKEVLRKGEVGNLFKLYIDTPVNYDAWDVDVFYREGKQFQIDACEIETITTGPVESVLTLKSRIQNSGIEQKIILRNNSKRLDFETKVDWHETRKMLRVSFPVQIFSSEASYEIQYGTIKRPLHSNTSWDMAKFEVMGQRYMDISEADYGAALLNDCKYGYSAMSNDLDLCLLRSPKYPDYNADQGIQIFTYSLLPHEHALQKSNVLQEAAILNRAPLLAVGVNTADQSPFRVEGRGLNLEVIKRAEKENSLILRLIETDGTFSTGILHTTLKGIQIAETDLLEWHDQKAISMDAEHPLSLSFKPFEIRTYKIRME